MITIQKASYAYHANQTVLEDVNLHFQSGHIYGLLGENGAGKTTLLKSLAGLVFPKSGTIDVLGHQPYRRRPDFLADIFMIPEDVELPDLLIERYVALYACFYPKFDRELFFWLLETFEVPRAARMEQLSFGQRKKVLIAFGLATKTRLILMDEPTNGLDIPSKSQFRKVMASELTEERCFIISTHQVRDLDQLIDQLVILSKQQVLLAASIVEISQALAFKVIPRAVPEALYMEETIQGIHAILPNKQQEDTKMDMELFFKGILLAKDQLISLLHPNQTINDEQYI